MPVSEFGSTLRNETVLQRDAGCVWRFAGGKVVILTTADYSLHELNEVASRVWEFVAEPTPVGELAERISSEYDVTAERASEDLVDFLPSLFEIGALTRAEPETESGEIHPYDSE